MPENFQPPAISDEDIRWVCDVLRLPSSAFGGTDGLDPRLEVLRSTASLDVEACPGSGKTTLLVAKLAILARNWNEPRRGVCVLSHTNVARREIEQRLGNTSAGQRLLGYPHFVGTIHSFVNEFLAVPWLRSKGISIRMIDNEVCQKRRWSKLPFATRAALEKADKKQTILEVRGPDFSVGDVKWGKGLLGKETGTYKALVDACRVTTGEGYLCYDEMFVWAAEYLDTRPEIKDALRHRFPILFIDEVQDNDEMQAALLHRIFCEGDRPVIRQRYGDSNQAIYGYAGAKEGASTDLFPDASIRRDIPNSHRFGQQIADLAMPFGAAPQKLVGAGPSKSIIGTKADDRNAIFLFDDKTIDFVLPTYSRYLSELFTPDELERGTFTAVGAVHRPTGDDNIPRHVGTYWPDYDHELTASEPKPSTFCQYILVGLARASLIGESYPIVEFLAEGVFALVRKVDPLSVFASRKRKHRHLMSVLQTNPELMAAYCGLVTSLMETCAPPTPEDWQKSWIAILQAVALQLSGSAVDPGTAAEFLKWEQTTATTLRKRDNCFSSSAHPQAEIRLGSIHSVKGETHTATLVLETFYRAHQLQMLKPWLLGKKAGGKSTEALRLKPHYVAMTRPSHLLCLAMRDDSLEQSEIDILKQRKWRVGRITSASVLWL